MNRYDPLQGFLARQSASEIILTFDEIGRLIGQALPQSAKVHEAFWANEAAADTRHYHCRAWRSAGYKVTTDRTAEIALFYKEN
jgi:hypothetical protein